MTRRASRIITLRIGLVAAAFFVCSLVVVGLVSESHAQQNMINLVLAELPTKDFFSDVEQSQLKTIASRFGAEVDRGAISPERATEALTELTQGKLAHYMIVQSLVRKFIGQSSSFSPTEKEHLTRQFRRLAEGLRLGVIRNEKARELFGRPGQVNDATIRALGTAAKSIADDAKIPNQDFSVDIPAAIEAELFSK